MDAEKYNREIALLCPTCGNTQFEGLDPQINEGMLRCASCGRTMSKDDLVNENSEVIEAAVEEVKEEIAEDFSKQLKKTLQDAFRGSKNIRIT